MPLGSLGIACLVAPHQGLIALLDLFFELLLARIRGAGAPGEKHGSEQHQKRRNEDNPGDDQKHLPEPRRFLWGGATVGAGRCGCTDLIPAFEAFLEGHVILGSVFPQCGSG